jgi:hypothetical protein
MRIDQALLDPASVYAAPEDVLADAALTKQQKIEILQRWEYDSREDAVAVEEGMPGSGGEMLRRILLAIDPLTDGSDVEHAGPTKQHGISRRSSEP